MFVPAENHQIALEAAVRAVDELTPLLGTTTSATVRSRLREQLSALDSEIARLENLPQRESAWEWVETDETFANRWERSDTEARRQLLLDAGVRFHLRKANPIEAHIHTP